MNLYTRLTPGLGAVLLLAGDGEGRRPPPDLVRTGDIARVSYRELNGWNQASKIQIKGRNTIASR